ncbi:LTA synthase family protein [Anaerobaca lacustris]|uniref:Sulfatase-like hydrolase/transferase n=1 Tax=Anaerobaca lacustris TaxID=3044600 RepID=A0AAW6TYE4_9BACT|nr:sulfatase-like hydrolase/transferase [Sedimentisphaerales bacterium M17dextr]
MSRPKAVFNAQREHAGFVRRLYGLLAPRAWSVIVFAALFCSLAVKLYHALRYGLLREYPSWILTDIAVLLSFEVVLSLICYRWPRKAVWRGALIAAAVVCTWSVVNAGWLIRTGTQILPMQLLSLIRDPMNIGKLVGLNLVRMPGAAAALLLPSAVALAFFFSVLARPVPPGYDPRTFRAKVGFSLVAIVVAIVGTAAASRLGSAQITAVGLRFNCHARAILAFLLPEYRHLASDDFSNATRQIPLASEVPVSLKPRRTNHNVVLLVLEGIQYRATSLAANLVESDGDRHDPTPYLATVASQGVSFTNARSVVTHTTKALFALLSGQRPGACQDIGETVPMAEPYASLATILEQGMGFRTAFFQSATGTFESRAGLVHNLGYQKFYAREDLNDPNVHVGYLGADEFALLEPIRDWIESDDTPFLLTIMCSVTHDPYEVPAWYGPMAATPVERYKQTIAYTDRFIQALDIELARLGLAENTVFCVVGDHGEAFGEHRIQGHDRVAYEEVLRIVMCIRAPLLIEAGRRVDRPVSSVDLAPTILDLLGFHVDPLGFDGDNALGPLPLHRKTYFAGWTQQGPSGFVQDGNKFVYYPEHNKVSLFRLRTDPLELWRFDLPEYVANEFSQEIIQWRKDTIFRIDQERTGQVVLFDSWLCRWNNRISSVRYIEPGR